MELRVHVQPKEKRALSLQDKMASNEFNASAMAMCKYKCKRLDYYPHNHYPLPTPKREHCFGDLREP